MKARFHFFGGKGGVGKTTCSAATAVHAADLGARVLLVSTDPAHSLGDALRLSLDAEPRRIFRKNGELHALELDAAGALAAWLQPRRGTLATIAERGTYLDREDVARFFDLSFPGVDELIALVELFRLAQDGDYDEVVVDTAPTGHTLRLLEMPKTLEQIGAVLDAMQDKHRLLAQALGGRVRADAADALIAELHAQSTALADLLRDPERSTLTWVALPESVVVAETVDALDALERDGLRVDELVLNRVTPKPKSACAWCQTRRAAEAQAIRELFDARALPPVKALEASGEEPAGVPALRRVGRALASAKTLALPPRVAPGRAKVAARSTAALAALEVPRDVRLLLFGGKGGVGKSTTAATCAQALAEQWPDRRVLLLSTDPAHSLGDALAHPIGDAEVHVPGTPKNLTVRELDANAAFAARREDFRSAVDELFDALRGGSRFDASVDRQIVRDLIDVAPPGLDEIFAVMSVIDALFTPGRDPKHRDLVIVDTAPTGHALRLLEMPQVAGDWVKGVLEILLKYRGMTGLGRLAQELVELSRGLRNLMTLLQNGTLTRFVVVTRAAELPTEESARLVRALAERKIARGGVVVNHRVPVDERRTCARCRKEARAERACIDAFLRRLRGHCGPAIFAPAVAPPPRGPEALRAWCALWQPGTKAKRRTA